MPRRPPRRYERSSRHTERGFRRSEWLSRHSERHSTKTEPSSPPIEPSSRSFARPACCFVTSSRQPATCSRWVSASSARSETCAR
jgi:hypothetical protein